MKLVRKRIILIALCGVSIAVGVTVVAIRHASPPSRRVGHWMVPAEARFVPDLAEHGGDLHDICAFRLPSTKSHKEWEFEIMQLNCSDQPIPNSNLPTGWRGENDSYSFNTTGTFDIREPMLTYEQKGDYYLLITK